MSGGCLFIVIYLLADIQSTYHELASATQITFSRGANVTLACNITCNRKIVWRRWYSPVPIAVGKKLFMNTKKYAFQGNHSDYQLTVISARRSDAGTYACVYKTAGKKVVQRFELMLKGATSFNESISGSSVAAACGRTARLRCNVNVRKSSKVIWMDNRGTLISVGKTSFRYRYRSSYDNISRSWQLKIRSVTKKDFGHFTCMVKGDAVMAVDVTLKRKGNSTLCSSVPGRHAENGTSPTTDETLASDEDTTLSWIDAPAREKYDDTRQPGPDDTPLLHQYQTGLVILGVGVCGVVSAVICVVAICTVKRITHLTNTALGREAEREPARTDETSLSRWHYSLSTPYESRTSVAPPAANIRNYRRSSSMGATTGVQPSGCMFSAYPSSAPHSLLVPGGQQAHHVPLQESDNEEEDVTDAIAV